MSRTKKTLLNARVNLIFYLLTTLISFYTRKIFLEYLGDEFIGFTSTIQSILGFLNMAELGIGTAIGFALYKPIYNQNIHEINKIIGLLGLLYKRVALTIILLSILVSFFLWNFFSQTGFSPLLIYFCFYSFLTSSLLGYFINYHQALLEADQKGYIITGYLKSANIIRLLVQMYLAIQTQNLYLWILFELIFAIIYSTIIRYKIKKTYPWLEINNKANNLIKEYSNILKKVKQLFVHKISTFMTLGTDQLLIYSIVNIESVAYYGNYLLIYTYLTNIINQLFAGVTAGVGNLVAENKQTQIVKVFWEMMSLRFFIAGLLIINLHFLITPFITIWLGDKYILSTSLVSLMSLNLFMMIVRIPVDNFISAYGLFNDTWAPVSQVICNLVVSIVFGNLWGIEGIVFGTTVSMLLIVILWKPIFLFRKGFKLNNVFKQYWSRFIKLLLCLFVTFISVDKIYSFVQVKPINNLIEWSKHAIFINLFILTFSILIFSLSDRGFRNALSRLKSILANKI